MDDLKWTTTPPTEPGWYWWRMKTETVTSDPEVSSVERNTVNGKLERWDIGVDYASPVWTTTVQWWPVRIEEPPR